MSLAITKFKQVAFLSPHPDDVELCCAILITRLLRQGSKVDYFCVTDGAPRSKLLKLTARPPANLTRPRYAAIRRNESLKALNIMRVPSSSIHFLGHTDLETYKDIPSIVTRLAALIPRYDTVVCCPFEGGHPDHDVTRFALACACQKARHYPQVIEYSSYNSKGYQRFLCPRPRQVTLRATQAELRLKRRIINAFTSQRDEAVLFRKDLERYRSNPKVPLPQFQHYDLTPHYEGFTYKGGIVLAAINLYMASLRTSS